MAAAPPCSAEVGMRHAMPRSGAMGTINAQTIACETPETFGTVLIMLDRRGKDGALDVMRQYPGGCYTLVVSSPGSSHEVDRPVELGLRSASAVLNMRLDTRAVLYGKQAARPLSLNAGMDLRQGQARQQARHHDQRDGEFFGADRRTPSRQSV